MKKLFALVMVVALAVALSGLAFAADTPAPAPGKAPAAAPAPAPAPAPAKPAAPDAKAAPAGVKATIKGKVASKTVNRKGQDVKVYEVAVAEAAGADGKSIDSLKGQTLRLGPKDKAAEFEKFDGKTAAITGAVVEGRKAGVKMLRVETIK